MQCYLLCAALGFDLAINKQLTCCDSGIGNFNCVATGTKDTRALVSLG